MSVDSIVVYVKFLFYFLLVGLLQKLRQTCQGCSNSTSVQQTVTKQKSVDDTRTKHLTWVQAIQSGELDRCEKVIQNGCSAMSVDPWGCTALHIASQNGALHVVQWLLSQDVDVDAVDSWDETPLHVAARNGHVDVCDCLVAHGASVHAVNAKDQNSLLVAALAGREHACHFLRSRGAVVEQVDSVPLQFQAWLVETKYESTVDEQQPILMD